MPGPAGGAPRIILVDHTGSLESRLRPALEAAGFDVRAVGSASACLEAVRDGTIDAVVSRHDLPDIDGVKLLRSLRVSYPGLPYVLAPLDGSETIAGDAVASGVSAYVPAETDPDTVVSRIDASLERARRAGEDERLHRYRHVIEMSPAPINVFDESGESIWCNEAVLDLLDLDEPGDLIGHSIFEFIHPDDHDAAREEVAAVTEDKESTGPTRMKLRTASGDVRYVQVSTAIGSFLGTDIGQAIVVDVTDQEERDRQLQVLEQWLRHNIRNETTVIQGTAESIERGLVEDTTAAAIRIQDHADNLVEQANHERRVIALLSESPAPRPTDLTSVVGERVRDRRETHPDASIEYEVMDGTADAVADTDATGDAVSATAIPEIGDAVDELIENAVEHNDRDAPTVEVSLFESDRGEAVVRIADDGPGIPERERKSLLIDHEVSPLDHGTGLGLVFIYWVVRLSGGDVAFEENDPRGSVVTVTLPDVEGA